MRTFYCLLIPMLLAGCSRTDDQKDFDTIRQKQGELIDDMDMIVEAMDVMCKHMEYLEYRIAGLEHQLEVNV